MSRTYRRRGNGKWRAFDSLGDYTQRWGCIDEGATPGYRSYRRIPLTPGTLEYKRKAAEYYGDFGSHNCKEPGPSWYRRLFTERPQRRKADRELQKFMADPDYEPMILPKDPLEYWM